MLGGNIRPAGRRTRSIRADDQEEDAAQQHGEVGAGFVHHAPEAVGLGGGKAERPEAVPEEDGIFVETMATEMLMIMGIAANRVSSPRISSAPQPISNTPTKGAMTSG